MIETLLGIILLCVVFGLLLWLVTLLPLPEPFPTIIKVCVVIICILLLLGIVFGGVDIPRVRLHA